jgi:hypothetical protein
LPHDPEPKQKDGKLPEPAQDRALKEAIDVFSGVLPANGEVDGAEDQADYSEYFRRFEDESKRLGVLYDRMLPRLEGGKEHDLIFDEATGSVLKFTKPSRAGYVVSFDFGNPRLVPALPLEYLERQDLHNQLFADNIRFVGMGGDPYNRRIITRQDLVKGRPAEWDEIDRMMVEDLGFSKLRDNHGIGYAESFAYIRDDVAVFDMRPPNVFMTDDGILVAIDSIPVRLSEEARKLLENQRGPLH